jgi:hypothetical protein
MTDPLPNAGLLLDDHCMLLLEDLQEQDEAVRAFVPNPEEIKIGDDGHTHMGHVFPYRAINRIDALGRQLIIHIKFLLEMGDIEPVRQGAWHVRLDGQQLAAILERSNDQRYDNATLRNVDGLSFEYGYPPAIMIADLYQCQKKVFEFSQSDSLLSHLEYLKGVTFEGGRMIMGGIRIFIPDRETPAQTTDRLFRLFGIVDENTPSRE